MKKVMKIEGMSCSHCQSRVEEALRGIDGVTKADVDLDGAMAMIECGESVTDEMLTQAVTEAGYEVKGIL